MACGSDVRQMAKKKQRIIKNSFASHTDALWREKSRGYSQWLHHFDSLGYRCQHCVDHCRWPRRTLVAVEHHYEYGHRKAQQDDQCSPQ